LPADPSDIRVLGSQLVRPSTSWKRSIAENRWDEEAGLRRDAVGSQVIDVLEAQEIKETGNEEG